MAEEQLGDKGDDLTFQNSDTYIEGVIKDIKDRSYQKKDGTMYNIYRIVIHYYNASNVLVGTCFDVYGKDNFNRMELCKGLSYGFTLRLLFERNLKTNDVYPSIRCIGAKRFGYIMK